jgi:hypothetical protein
MYHEEAVSHQQILLDNEVIGSIYLYERTLLPCIEVNKIAL